jgi:ferredoxin-NADP reductase
VGVTITLTRADGAAGAMRRGRVDTHLLSELAWPAGDRPQVFVCGPTPFVESVANDLIALGHAPSSIKTERFG